MKMNVKYTAFLALALVAGCRSHHETPTVVKPEPIPAQAADADLGDEMQDLVAMDTLFDETRVLRHCLPAGTHFAVGAKWHPCLAKEATCQQLSTTEVRCQLPGYRAVRFPRAALTTSASTGGKK
jgi:hypothetical protein